MDTSKGMALALAIAGVGLLACEQPTHEERVAELRSQYEAELNSFVTREVPQEVDPVTPVPGEETGDEAIDETDTEATDEADDEAMEGEEGIVEEDLLPPRTDVILDIVVRHSAPEMLPGITLDVSHADADEVEKDHFRIWVETSGLAKGETLQVNETFEDVDFEEGDRFFVEVRHSIPPEERSEYWEFSEAESPESQE